MCDVSICDHLYHFFLLTCVHNEAVETYYQIENSNTVLYFAC